MIKSVSTRFAAATFRLCCNASQSIINKINYVCFSAHEPSNAVPYREQEIYLPIANVARIMKNSVPHNGKVCVFKCSLCTDPFNSLEVCPF